MTLLRRFQAIHSLLVEARSSSCMPKSSGSCHGGFSNGLNSPNISYEGHTALPWTNGSRMTFHSSMMIEAGNLKGVIVAVHGTKELVIPGRCFTARNHSDSSFPDKPTAAYYDDLVNAAGIERDFEKLHYLLNKRVRDHCYNTTNTFKFISNSDNSLSILDSLSQTLARLDKGFPRTSAYNTLIARLCKLDRVQEALHIVDIMIREGYGIQSCSFHPILCSLTHKKKMKDAWEVIEKMKDVGAPPDLTAYNYLLTAYCYNGNLVDACKVMKRIEEEGLGADSRTYDALVLGTCRAGKVEAALVVLRRMVDDGVHIMYSTFTHIINALLRLGYYAQATKLVRIYGGKDTALDTETFGVLAYKLIKLEKFEEAKLLLQEMDERGLAMGHKLRDHYMKVRNVN